MSRSILIFILILGNSFSLHAQDTLTCQFERLFKIKAGMTKTDVVAYIGDNYKATLINTDVSKLPPYKGSKGDSIIKEILSYKPDQQTCFNGRNTLFQLEFADNKLYKAYLSTMYPKSQYQDMIANYNSLRNVIKTEWAYEKEIKISGDNMAGFGYDYTKTKKTGKKTEKVSLMYVDSRSDDPSGNYLLEVLWANLANTRMESSNY
jgi:hypothetical protein